MTSEFSVAVHALVFLDHKRAIVSSETLSENICTNPARVRKIMAQLKKANLIETREGADGGYLFTADPAAVTLDEVGKAFDAQYVCASWHSGNSDLPCLIASGMAGVMDDIYKQLNHECAQKLKTITIADIDFRIFGKQT